MKNPNDHNLNQEIDVTHSGVADSDLNIDTKSGVSSARFESSEQRFQEELSLKSMTQILIQNWALFLIIFISLMSISLIIYKYKIPFQSIGSVIINDTKNSSLQSFSNQFSGQNLGFKSPEAKKNNSSVLKQIEYLSTADFFLKLTDHLMNNIEISQMTQYELKGFKSFKNFINIEKNKASLNEDEKIFIIQKMDSLIKINLKSDFEAEVSIKSLDKNLSYFVAKNSIQFISNQLRDSEKNELNKIKDFLTSQKNISEESIQKLNKQLSDFQSQPQNLVSLSASKVGDYISDLMMRKNEVRMKISENNQLIDSLSSTTSNRRDSALYGTSGKIATLKNENEVLKIKTDDLQKSIDRMLYQAKSIPTAAITYDELKRKTDLEFEKYKQVNLDLSKIEASELSINNKFEVLEMPRYDKVKPIVGLLTLFLICIVISQALGSLIIYLRTIWHTKYVTAEQTKNIVVIDGHSLDPRVIIENSKIRFSLQNSSIKNDDYKDTKPNKLGFSIPSKKTVNSEVIN